MNRKIIGILGLVGLVLTGCAAPEVETEQTMMGSYSSDEIMQDNGRKIEKHFQNEGEDGVLDINAVVDIPDIKKALYKVKNGIFPCWKICCVQGQI